MARSLFEWIGPTDDTPAPPRVRVRVFERHGGRCHVTGRKIQAGEPWELEHVVAIINGGENRESNLAPVLKGKAHRTKTARDVAEKAKVYRTKRKHLGLRPPSRLQGRGFPKCEPQRTASRPLSKAAGYLAMAMTPRVSGGEE